MIVLVAWAVPANAHDLLLTTIEMHAQGGQTELIVRTPLTHLARAEQAPGYAMDAPQIDIALRRRLEVDSPTGRVAFRAANLTVDENADMLQWRVIVPTPVNLLVVRHGLFPEEPATRTRIARIDGPSQQIEWLGSNDRIIPETSRFAEFYRFLILGMEHILSGPDHLAFLLGLLLLGGSLRKLLVTVSAFTVAHSVTLGLAVSGLARPSPRVIEPLIALSVAVIGFENLYRRGSLGRRPWYAFGFGLVHGFGLAGPLTNLGIGADLKSLLAALVPFNVGVEIAQVGVLLALWVLLKQVERGGPIVMRRVSVIGSGAIAVAGMAWFGDRVMFSERTSSVVAGTLSESAASRVQATFAPFALAVKTRHDDSNFYVESNGMPDHPMMVGITAWQQQVPLPQKYAGSNAWQFPLFPQVATSPLSAKDHFFRGAIAIAADGVPIFNPIKNDGVTDTNLAGELDVYGGHGGRADDYHYHLPPVFLQAKLGVAVPLAYALDGYPIYGLKEPEGSATGKLDALNGHVGKDGTYHYHSTSTYPYLNGGFHGKVTDRDGQVDPQPHGDPVRPAGEPLRGAKVTGFEKTGENSFELAYTVGGETRKIRYTIQPGGHYDFTYIDGRGESRNETYTANQRRPSGGRRDGNAPPTDESGPPEKH